MRLLACAKQMLNLVLLMTLLLGCVEATRRAVAVATCGSNATIQPEVQRRVAAEMELLPSTSVIRNVILPDWLRMRDENRACARRPGG
jgi:hypothetical protein